MEVHVLASGSSGNALFLRAGHSNILVDAGISARRIKHALAAVNTDVASLHAVFITHEHSDHVKGLATLSRHYHVPVYTRPDTWRAIPERCLPPADCRRAITDTVDVGPVKVAAFGVSHDARDPVGYTFFWGRRKCTVATDLGFVTPTVRQALRGSDVVVLEANHDLTMLTNGAYPWPLKRRIMSNRGHLSNCDAGWALARYATAGTQVFLAHLSQENNRPALAYQTVTDILQRQGYAGRDISVQLTCPDQTVSWDQPDGQHD